MLHHLAFQIRARTKVGYGENITIIVQGKLKCMYSLHNLVRLNVCRHNCNMNDVIYSIHEFGFRLLMVKANDTLESIVCW